MYKAEKSKKKVGEMEALEKTVCPNGQSKGLVTQLTAELKSCPDSSVDIVFSIK